MALAALDACLHGRSSRYSTYSNNQPAKQKKGKRIDCGDSTTREDEKNEMRRPMRTEAEEEDGDGRMEDTRRIPKKTTGETGDRRY
jgi:hypothetical protein